MQPLALYIHIPFCEGKCRYCDFLSFASPEDEHKRYFDALIKEIRISAESLKTHEVTSIYIGGGTPSFPDSSYIVRVMKELRDHFKISQDAEITIEVNPGTADAWKLSAYYDIGVNRLSIGAQSLQDSELMRLGRRHSANDFFECFRDARTTGFRNISVDVMMGLPGQNLTSYMETLRMVCDLRPEHISSYSLTIEKGTPFYEVYGSSASHSAREAMLFPLPGEETERRMYEETNLFLRSAGFHRYEISNYASDVTRQSRHNKVYWQRGDYLGVGLGASSMINNTRFSNVDTMEKYIETATAPDKRRVNVEKLSKGAQMEEFMFLGLRMTEGVSVPEFARVFGKPIENVYGDVLRSLLKEELISIRNEYLVLTPRGVDVSNRVFARFLLEETEEEIKEEEKKKKKETQPVKPGEVDEATGLKVYL